tara:strand:+ start:210 stop:485 length:276 start_codon:yes stop_codon:yes gene_type:complete
MIVETPHGEFECQDITRKERRKHYGKVKQVYANNDAKELHELADEFILIAFNSEEEADERLKGLSALQEDEVITAIILAYMGLDSGNDTGD